MQSEAESLGVRDWPQTATSAELVDARAGGALRYVLEGTGSVCADGDEPVAGAVNTLVRVDGGGTLRWVPDDEPELMRVLRLRYTWNLQRG